MDLVPESKVYGDGHCVAFVKEYAGLGPTSGWKRGKKVRGNEVARGTPIATFDAAGAYTNVSGSSHAAIFWSQTSEGIVVYDQWKGQPCHQRTLKFGATGTVNNGDNFYIVDKK